MRGRGGSVAQLERELEALRATIAETEAEQARQAELAQAARIEERRTADDPAAFAAAARRAHEHGDERKRLTYVLDQRRQDLDELERRLALARFEDGRSALESAQARAQDASRAFAGKVAAADKAAAAMVAARDEVDAARARARELCPADVEFELPENADEADWLDVARLVELLQAGPRRPLANAAADSARVARDSRRSADSVLSQAVRAALRTGDVSRLERLSASERERAVRFAEGQAKTILAEISGVSSNGDVLDVAGPPDRQRPALERRLERIRELATTTEAVEIT